MTLTVSAVPVGSSPPRVQLDVSSSPAVTEDLSVVRVHSDGSEYPVLGVGSLISTWTGVDIHAPFNAPVTYRAEAGAQSVTSGSVVVMSDESWLIHSADPDLSVLIDKIMSPMQDFRHASRATRYEPLNRRLPVHRIDMPRGGETGQVVIKCPTQQDRDQVRALLASDLPVLMNTPFADYPWKWVQVGDDTYSNPGQQEWFAYRTVTLPFEETTQPDVDTALWTLGDLKSAAPTSYPTLGDLKAAYSGRTLKDLKMRAV